MNQISNCLGRLFFRKITSADYEYQNTYMFGPLVVHLFWHVKAGASLLLVVSEHLGVGEIEVYQSGQVRSMRSYIC